MFSWKPRMKCRRSGTVDELLHKCHRAAQFTVEQGTRECAEKIHHGMLGEDILRKGMLLLPEQTRCISLSAEAYKALKLK